MRHIYRLASALALGSCALSTTTLAANGHYVAGVEGLDAPVVPPPGFYYRGYLIHYDIDSLRDGRGQVAPGSISGEITALANRFVWVSDKRVLGADYGMGAVISLLDTSLHFDGVGLHDSDSGIGDIFLEPVLLGWHGERWDAVASAGYWFDTGDFSADQPASVGKGFSSTMLTLGGAWYFDVEKRWAFSALSRYEIHDKQSETGIIPGDSLTMEWSFSRQFDNNLKLGLVGYDTWQLEADSGVPTEVPNDKAEQHAIGAEMGYFLPALGLGLNAAFYNEYDNHDRPQGDLFRLTLTKGF